MPPSASLLGGGEALVDAAHRGDDRHVAPFPRERRRNRSERRAVHLALVGVQALVLEEDDRVVVVDRRAQKPLRVGRCRGSDDLDPGDPGQPRGRHLRVDRAEAAAGADDRPDHDRDAAPLLRQEPVLRHLVDDAVHDEREEVAEHDLDHRAEPVDGRRRRRRRRARAPRSACRRRDPAPCFSYSPGVTAKTPPAIATSSPKKIDALVGGERLVERLANGGTEVDRRGIRGRGLGLLEQST